MNEKYFILERISENIEEERPFSGYAVAECIGYGIRDYRSGEKDREMWEKLKNILISEDIESGNPIASDGKEIKAGENVWYVNMPSNPVISCRKRTVEKIEKVDDIEMFRVYFTNGQYGWPKQLTHEEQVYPDSWTKLENDAKAWVNPTMEERADIVRRAKILSEREKYED